MCASVPPASSASTPRSTSSALRAPVSASASAASMRRVGASGSRSSSAIAACARTRATAGPDGDLRRQHRRVAGDVIGEHALALRPRGVGHVRRGVRGRHLLDPRVDAPQLRQRRGRRDRGRARADRGLRRPAPARRARTRRRARAATPPPLAEHEVVQVRDVRRVERRTLIGAIIAAAASSADRSGRATSARTRGEVRGGLDAATDLLGLARRERRSRRRGHGQNRRHRHHERAPLHAGSVAPTVPLRSSRSCGTARPASSNPTPRRRRRRRHRRRRHPSSSGSCDRRRRGRQGLAFLLGLLARLLRAARCCATFCMTAGFGATMSVIARASIIGRVSTFAMSSSCLEDDVELLVRLLGVRDLAAAEAHGELHLVAGLEEAARRLHLEVDVVVVGLRAELDLLDLDDRPACACASPASSSPRTCTCRSRGSCRPAARPWG